ncbi:beta-galactosidase [Dactylosporangium siamense]|uniref:Beta-galactosidase n=1 Tax=Dactylosporangium siamense TaxID=685454 RepID=A0A919PQ39_9ACTN|nr:beta-galactosidase [Dactylosporangium siamense]GIG48004.1 beta-galactosidase [Dactylosporangium siamense]
MHFGTSWYPEQWPVRRWETDLRLMAEAGMTVVRLGDFAWSRLEPSPGHYELQWLVDAVDAAAAHGLACVVTTPTAGPPAWLTAGWPEVLAVDAQGRRASHGNRTHAALSSPRYREFCVGIAEAMARRLGDHPDVLGWQIDNEINTVSFDDATRATFQQWLRGRYGTTEELNRRWSTVFWSQEYTDWAQIPLPTGPAHPSLALAWRRFVSETFRDHLEAQAAVVRAHARPGQWISANVMTWFGGFDQTALAAQVDLVGLDYYPGHLDHPDAGGAHAAVRGLKRRNHWVMEVQPGSNCWAGVNHTLDRGEARRIAWNAVGHGADGLLYWQWRAAPGGQEQYHGTLIGADGEPRPFYTEAAEVGREFAAAAAALAGTEVSTDVAILSGDEDRWAIGNQRHHRDFDPVEHLLTFYRPLRLAGLQPDILAPDAALHGYRLVVAPSLHLVDDAGTAALLDWVRAGGHLLLGARTGVKDRENALLPSRPPGPLGVAGIRVAEFYALEHPVPVSGPLLGATEASASIWAEWLTVTGGDARVLLRYGPANGWLDGEPAVVAVPFGAGQVTYCGAWLDPVAMTALVRQVVAQAGLAVATDGADGTDRVEVCRRVGPDGADVLILINHDDRERSVTLPVSRPDLLIGGDAGTVVTLPPGGVRVLGAAN